MVIVTDLIETVDVQNRLAKLEGGVYLNVSKPNAKLKRQYHKALKALADAKHEFDLLNDLKEDSTP